MRKIVSGFLDDFSNINECYTSLIAKTKKFEYVGIVNEWLIDNFYILVEHKTNILQNKKLIKKDIKRSINLYNCLKAISIKYNYNLNINTLTKEINNYQEENNIYFTFKEINNIKKILLFIYTNKLKEVYSSELIKLDDKALISKTINEKEKRELTLENFIEKDFKIEDNANYIFELNNAFKSLGVKSNKLFKDLNNLLSEKNISLKELINNEYNIRMEKDILVANIFNDLKEFFEIDEETLIKEISLCEKLLLEDKVYKKMTSESKILYRNTIIKKSKQKRKDELTYLKHLLEKIDIDDYHIGFILFKNKKNNFKFLLYIIIVLSLSTLITFAISNYFINSLVLGFILLIIPTTQLIIKIVNNFLVWVTPSNVLPKINYLKGITEESKTMIVIPTIISDKKKLKEMFNLLEKFYLINHTPNLYFSLLADAKTENVEKTDYDDEIVEYGKKVTEELNKKYKKDLFHFIYRKRRYNEKEDAYLGYERKRGALLQFNQILLNKMSLEEQKLNLHINTLENFNQKIKYVLTLDTDSQLVLSSLLKLVGAMAHPLNKPVLNKAGTKVIDGYALMQPRVGNDIESTNQSLYSQIFAGIGGFDTYTAIIPNLGQDVFGESSFIGKGIYDLEICDQILNNAFPENLVLSHDLLEGNYLRCGYVSDVELIENFPSKFLTDATRQHRWARGDVQILGWLLPRVRNLSNKKVKNPLNFLGKWKILDNVIRMLYFPMMLIIMLITVFLPMPINLYWVMFIILQIALPIIFYIKNKLVYKKNDNKTTVYYSQILFGLKSIVYRSYIILSTIPFYAKLYMDALIKASYRLLVTKKNLLNWITAEEAEQNAATTIKEYLLNFIPNLVVGLILLIIGAVTINATAISFAILFISAPFIIYEVSKTIDYSDKKLSKTEIEEVKNIAEKTWRYFRDNLKEEYNYLISDNYQENREQKLDMRTSPTAIGYSLTSVISAESLGFINSDAAVSLLANILKSIKSLEKWNGHLYNWYDIRTKKVLHPGFVSTIDSGNLVAALILTKEFLVNKKEEELVELTDKLIKNTNFKKLYTKKDVFSIGYDEREGQLSIYNYNKFASESRLTSYIAIALGQVPTKHWFCLDKSLTTHKGKKGLISWSGTSFEYFMPLLFMRNYQNTMLDETYKFSIFCQEDYMNSVSNKLPWGISESAYSELDNSLNYKYYAFGVPYLKAKEEKNSKIVISPYSSLMAMELFEEEVYENIKKMLNIGLLGKYGFYEAYDYDNDEKVQAFFAHHQGMSLLGLANYLKDNEVKNYFHQNVNIKTYDILLKEKAQLKTSIDMKMDKYKKYNYQKEKIENDIRVFNYISEMPEVSVLSNKKYSLLLNDRGNGYSSYRTLQMNRYRKITEQDYGMFLYIKDLESNYVWSNTYAPINKKPDKYEVVFAADKIKYLRTDGCLTTSTEIIVTNSHHAEIRKITIKNESDKLKTLELTTYTEPIISENMADVSHKVFNNMFLTVDFDCNTNSLISVRNARGDSTINNYMVNKLLITDPVTEYSYETDRAKFIGRNRNTDNPQALNQTLTNQSGTSIDPIMSIRNKIEIEPNGSTTVYLISGFGRSKEQIQDIVKSYSTKQAIDNAFKMSNLMNVVNTKVLNITGENMRTYNMMLNYLYQTTKISVSEERMNLLRKNALSQSSLWKFAISGDRPIILVEISDIADMSFITDILKCFEYYKNNSIFVDVIIVNGEGSQYTRIIKKEIDEQIYRMYTLNNFYHTPGEIKVVNKTDINKEEQSLFDMVPRLKFIVKNNITLKEAVEKMAEKNQANQTKILTIEKTEEMAKPQKLTFDNGYGGFKNNGNEYVIYNKDTTLPWSNVIANKNFGTIVTNNGCGYTFAYNSGEYKITSWTNEMVLNDKSEGFNFNDQIFDPAKCTHGFGYSILESETTSLKKQITQFVPKEDTVKIYLVKLTNKLSKPLDIKLDYWINPTLGNFEEKTARHILTEHIKNDNYLKLRNVYSINHADIITFMSSSEKITDVSLDRILTKSIENNITLREQEEKELVFILGTSKSDDETLNLINKYNDVIKAKNTLAETKNDWLNKLKTIEVKTPDESFNYMINGWYLYQSISSRINAKAGFYQVSGAFGYRDQLQDSMNISLVDQEYAKKQIITNAKHQFIKGDVLHWWHEQNRFGLRSKYKDDFLWLVYATINYIKTTKDYKILEELVPYIQGEELSEYEHEKGIIFTYTDEKETLLNHCLKSLDFSMNALGKHGLPLMGGGDWNDGMNKVGVKGKGESVWIGMFLHLIIKDFVILMNEYDSNFNTEKYTEFNNKLKNNLNKKAWDKDYYLRAYFDNGDKMGSHENDECKIDLISQSFAILSEIIPSERIDSVIQNVEEQLVDKDNKIIKLLTPPFKKSLNNPGYIMSYPKGIRENGGQYTHATSWYIMALIKLGMYDKAFEYFQMINPVNRSKTKEEIDLYKVEPYVIAADIYSSEIYPKRGGWTWYTGSAAWHYNVGIKEILGFEKQGDKLIINPHVPKSWNSYKMVYHYEDTTYNIEVEKGNTYEVEIDNKKITTKEITLVNDKTTHNIKITYEKE